MAERLIHPVVLSGGAGTRLWPLSRTLYPKQLLPLTAESTLLQETVARVGDRARFAPPLVICNEDHRFIIAEQLRQAADATPGGRGNGAVVLEPVGRNTAPAIACAALLLSRDEPEATMLVLPSDHRVAKPDAFLAAVDVARRAAADGALVTFGITPNAPETGYGYIRRGGPYRIGGTDLPGCFTVGRFVEKPDRATAETFLADGGYTWNSGMFLFGAAAYLAELGRLEPEMLARCREAVDAGRTDLDFFRLDRAAFERCPAQSIDYAVMEHAARAAVVPVDAGWSDVGSWSALWTVGGKDADGNVRSGDVIAADSRNSYLRAEGPLLCAVGVEDLVVVATEDAVLVVPRAHAEAVGPLVKSMAADGRNEPHAHLTVYRPWGSYRTIRAGEGFQVKHIVVNPGGCLSLQKHHQRAEHWVVVRGTAHVIRGEDALVLNANQSTYIPREAVHRLENKGSEPLDLIEVQTGGYLGEDDIVRLEDVYGRK
jgi:mannose-1-phosphate guanylyltransferase/mannose-1-phosphate guanylyltransferase/mannose-6-phosphate isomerase